MNAKTLREAQDKARIFLTLAAKVGVEKASYGTQLKDYTKESAACKRASMDLTRALAELRKPG